MMVICECGSECEKVSSDTWLCGACGETHVSFDDEPECDFDELEDDDGDE